MEHRWASVAQNDRLEFISLSSAKLIRSETACRNFALSAAGIWCARLLWRQRGFTALESAPASNARGGGIEAMLLMGSRPAGLPRSDIDYALPIG
jgi:hypothetical protein